MTSTQPGSTLTTDVTAQNEQPLVSSQGKTTTVSYTHLTLPTTPYV